jgi:diacylglycerol kinase family enzyme
MDMPSIRHPFLVMNPRSGGGKVGRFALREKAEHLGATVVILEDAYRDLGPLLRQAVDDGADLLGAAGGDGTLGVVAGVAVERGVEFMVVPAGTRNHFAMDLGLDRAHPDQALDALCDGEVLLVDLGTANGRPFVNTASFGAYADIVERPDYRNDKLRVTVAALPELAADHEQHGFTVAAGNRTVTDPIAALVSNNPYDKDVGGLDRRSRLDTGVLGLICVRLQAPGPPPALVRGLRTDPPVIRTTAVTVVVDAAQPTIAVAIDGESVQMQTPVRCSVLPHVLRVRVPRQRQRHGRPPGGLREPHGRA